MADGFQGAAIAPENRPGLNSTGSLIPKGTVVKITAAGRVIDLVDSVLDVIYGVASNDIPDGSRGDITIRGTALVIANATLTPGVRAGVSTTARATDQSTTGSVLGIVIEAGSAGELVEIELLGPGAAGI